MYDSVVACNLQCHVPALKAWWVSECAGRVLPGRLCDCRPRLIWQLWGRSWCCTFLSFCSVFWTEAEQTQWVGGVCSDTPGPLLDPASIYWGQIWKRAPHKPMCYSLGPSLFLLGLCSCCTTLSQWSRGCSLLWLCRSSWVAKRRVQHVSASWGSPSWAFFTRRDVFMDQVISAGTREFDVTHTLHRLSMYDGVGGRVLSSWTSYNPQWPPCSCWCSGQGCCLNTIVSGAGSPLCSGFHHCLIWVVSSANFLTMFVEWLAEQSCVNRGKRAGLSTHPCGVNVFSISVDDVQSPILTTSGLLVRKSLIQ